MKFIPPAKRSKSIIDVIDLIARSKHFDPDWYCDTYRDVTATGLSAAEHYLFIGASLERDPSPSFSSQKYLIEHTDVAAAGMNPLVHYERHGIKAKRRIFPASSGHVAADKAIRASEVRAIRKTLDRETALHLVLEVFHRRLVGKPHRVFPAFDARGTSDFVDALCSLAPEVQEARKLRASIVMPTYNRANELSAAIGSVLTQTHRNIELLVIDDGSTDTTSEVLRQYAHDKRVRVFHGKHTGVSAARNIGLTNCTGDVVFYLDSDNTWTNSFVELMLISLVTSGADCAYGASRLQDKAGNLIAYRGEPYNWHMCINGNYVDMNVFCHKRTMLADVGYFDTTLKRMVDWDLILRFTKNNRPIYVPVIGCLYTEDAQDSSRITISQPYAYRKVVHEKNLKGFSSSEEALKYVKFNIAIKIPAPEEKKQAWGDYHYAESLKEAFERLGHKVRIDFLGTWYDRPILHDDIAIVLRGLTEYIPRPGQISLMWNISHPDQVSYDEYRKFHGIFVASESYSTLLSIILGRRVETMLQCTDSHRFSFHPIAKDAKGIFVGNSRKEYRQIVKWARDASLDLTVYGQDWEAFLDPAMIKGRNIDNRQLAQSYASSGFVLNDHWQSMQEFGLVSNRVFDVIGCGGDLISDHLPSIHRLFGGSVKCVKSSDELAVAAGSSQSRTYRQRKEASDFVHKNHSFDHRAEQFIEWIRCFLSPASASEGAERATKSDRIKVGVIVQNGRAWPTSSAFIRLFAPLTTDSALDHIEVVHLTGQDDPRLSDIKVCIVQRVAIADMTDAEKLVATLKANEASLFVDTDDAFHFHEQHIEHDAVLQFLMRNAREVWFSTENLSRQYEHLSVPTRVVANHLDPRLWKNYRKAIRTNFSEGPVKFLYMGTATHDKDFDEVLQAFEQLAMSRPGKFHLTLVGAVRNPPKRDWLSHVLPPSTRGSYPEFVRWLRDTADYDVGIAPLAKSKFNSCKSDVKFLDYSALGLLSILSDCDAYKDVLSRGLALGCGGTTREWVQAFEAVIDEPLRFTKMRQDAIAFVWNTRSVVASEDIAALPSVLLSKSVSSFSEAAE